MKIEEVKIVVRANNFNEKHFKSLGYIFNKNEYLEVPIRDLPKGSGLKIDVKCSYCGKIFKKAYRRYLESKDSLCCKNCKDIKMIETSLEKYGNRCSLRNPNVLKKAISKNQKNLGVDYPFQNEKILKKCRESHYKKYGRWVGATRVSSQQRTFHSIYGGKLDYGEHPFYLDIFFENEKVYFEYDGSGHRLGIRFKAYSEEEFEIREDKRRAFLRDKGYKEFRILSTDDILPNNDELLRIKNVAFYFLLTLDYQFYIYNLNTKIESFGK